MEENDGSASLFSSFRTSREPGPARAQPQASTPPADNAQLPALENAVRELRAELAELRERMKQAPAGPPTAGAGEKDRIETLPEGPKQDFSEALAAMRKDVDAVNGGFEDLKRKIFLYAEEFSAIERECRASLGNMKGYVKAAEQETVAERFDDYLKDSVASLAARLADAEVAMHAAVAGLAGRLNANEALYGRMFAEAEERLKKTTVPEIKQLDSRLKGINNDVIWLKDEYSIVMERKIRALEGKCSAFNAISKRMDAISKDLNSGRKQ